MVISLEVKFISQSMNSASAGLDKMWAGEAIMLVFFLLKCCGVLFCLFCFLHTQKTLFI